MLGVARRLEQALLNIQEALAAVLPIAQAALVVVPEAQMGTEETVKTLLLKASAVAVVGAVVGAQLVTLEHLKVTAVPEVITIWA